jgi:hypothetical protein
MHIALSRSGEDLRRSDPQGAALPFERGCELGLDTACRNAQTLADGSDQVAPSQPTLRDFPILLRGSKGEMHVTNPQTLFALACGQGWPMACGR